MVILALVDEDELALTLEVEERDADGSAAADNVVKTVGVTTTTEVRSGPGAPLQTRTRQHWPYHQPNDKYALDIHPIDTHTYLGIQHPPPMLPAHPVNPTSQLRI